MGSRISAFQSRALQIDADFRAGLIGPQTRRELLERARDQHLVTNLVGQGQPAHRGQPDHLDRIRKRGGRQ